MSKQIFPYTNHSRMVDPDTFVSGTNDTIINSNGKKYVDCNSGLWNVNYGYNNSIYDDVAKIGLHFYPTHFWSTTEETETAASRLCQHFGYHKVFFGHSGSDAINTAIYISKWENKKREVLAYCNGYHGSAVDVKICNNYLELINSINQDTSAVLIEPLMVTHGIIEFDRHILEQIFALRDRFGFNIIFDETVTAIGRGDYYKAWDSDILIASKGLTNGVFPISAVLVNDRLANHITRTDEVFSHGFTTSGHPIGCNAVCKTLDLYSIQSDRTEEFRSLFQRYELNVTCHRMVFAIPVSDGIKLRRLLQKEGYLIRQRNDTLLLLPMFTADINNYIRFAEIVSTFQVCDR